MSLFPELCDTPFIASELPNVLKEFQKCELYVQTSVLKTLFNSWTTSDRMHSDFKLPCLFGCRNEKDILSHYLGCPTLWRQIDPERDVYTCSWRSILGFQLGKDQFILLARASCVYHSAQHEDVKEPLLPLQLS